MGFCNKKMFSSLSSHPNNNSATMAGRRKRNYHPSSSSLSIKQKLNYYLISLLVNVFIIECIFATYIRVSSGGDQSSTTSNNPNVYHQHNKYAPNSNINSFGLINDDDSNSGDNHRYGDVLPSCSDLYGTQFTCDIPSISDTTYEFEGCRPNNTVPVKCYAREGVNCSGDKTFYKQISCYYTTGVSFSTALGLSIFFGVCGIDRFYLGYVGYGLFKLFTFGGIGLLWIYDVVLIAMQVVTPQDGSNYLVGFNGPRNIKFVLNNSTYVY